MRVLSDRSSTVQTYSLPSIQISQNVLFRFIYFVSSNSQYLTVVTRFLNDAGINEHIDTAWKLVNDSYFTDALLLYPPHIIALAAVYTCAFMHGKDISKWFMNLNVNINEVGQAVADILHVYEIWNSPYFEREVRAILERVPRANAANKKPKK